MKARSPFVLPVVAAGIAAALPPLASADAQGAPLSVTWLGGPSMLIRFDGFEILTDPMLGEGEQAFRMGDPNEMFELSEGPDIKFHRRLTSVPDIDLEDVELVILSHAHEDHFDQEAQRRLDKEVELVLPPHDLEGIREKGFENLIGLPWERSITYSSEEGRITLTAVMAHHSADATIGELLGEGNGYWMEFEREGETHTLYWTGDTLPTEAVLRQADSLGELDILVPHMGRVGTSGPLGQISMGSEEVMHMADRLEPGRVLPIHHSTYELYLEPISRFVADSRDAGLEADVIAEGATLVYR